VHLKKSRKIPIKYYFFLFLFVLTFIVSIQVLNHFHVSFTNQEFLKFVLEDYNRFEKTHHKDFSYYLVKYALRVDLKNPVSIFMDSYKGSVVSSSDEVLVSNPSSSYVEDPYPEKEVKEPLVYIYNTHQLEEYSTSGIEEFGVVPNVMMASYILREKLYEAGISSIVEDNDVSEFLKTNNWNYASSYKVTRYMMEDASVKNASLKYFVDLHRDSVSKKISTVQIGDKSYAKILFIVGLENENYEENLKTTGRILDLLEEDYPGITRGIYKKQGKGVNGVYNQDFDKNVFLVEMGGYQNTLDEVLNSTIALSEVLVKYIQETEGLM